MSYDIRLKDPVTKEVVNLPNKHLMIGGTFAAKYDPNTDTFSPIPISEAWLNITYNYGHYYYDATNNDPRFAHDEVSAYYADGTIGPIKTEYGIRGIYGKSGAESISMLEDMVSRIKEKYTDKNGNWISTNRNKVKYWNKDKTKELDFYNDILGKLDYDEFIKEEYIETISEGPNKDYWESTAANAISPLYKLIAMAKLRPDAIWDGD